MQLHVISDVNKTVKLKTRAKTKN